MTFVGLSRSTSGVDWCEEYLTSCVVFSVNWLHCSTVGLHCFCVGRDLLN